MLSCISFELIRDFVYFFFHGLIFLLYKLEVFLRQVCIAINFQIYNPCCVTLILQSCSAILISKLAVLI